MLFNKITILELPALLTICLFHKYFSKSLLEYLQYHLYWTPTVLDNVFRYFDFKGFLISAFV